MLQFNNKAYFLPVLVILLCAVGGAAYGNNIPTEWEGFIHASEKDIREHGNILMLEKNVRNCYSDYYHKYLSAGKGTSKDMRKCFVEDLYLQYKAHPFIKELFPEDVNASGMPYYLNPSYANSRIIIERSFLFKTVDEQRQITHRAYLMSKTPVEKWGELK
ncbi:MULTISPECIES: hypothetical protein [unclassified Saccharibacter]|uniref:hypothetical protein n=1 Tax=unclassified Saccharibacter TaxID=2648722 RepID=UPI001321B892|nr:MULTISPECIES: hypothetical protein [unclassified Saccharibacter]MXV36821.1 hypothetical protein [Saccharibacter sp. EH611]MXV58689.1 hypothetical protein [Saccharibacter sp. EH70]MXV66195.1 hypothetical protein [Saccharibacter sp. EH60]